jgi:hypothetical protein
VAEAPRPTGTRGPGGPPQGMTPEWVGTRARCQRWR